MGWSLGVHCGVSVRRGPGHHDRAPAQAPRRAAPARGQVPGWGREAQRQACGASITDHVQQSLTVVEAACRVPLGVGVGERLQASLLVEATGPGEAARIDVRCARSPPSGHLFLVGL